MSKIYCIAYDAKLIRRALRALKLYRVKMFVRPITKFTYAIEFAIPDAQRNSAIKAIRQAGGLAYYNGKK